MFDEEDGEEASISPVARDEESGKLYTKEEVYKALKNGEISFEEAEEYLKEEQDE